MAYGIRFIAMAGIDLNPHPVRIYEGDWLKDFDADAFEGMGAATWTPDPKQARAFRTIADAVGCFRTQSSARPLRGDGLPNRPLMAYTITIEEIEEVPSD